MNRRELLSAALNSFALKAAFDGSKFRILHAILLVSILASNLFPGQILCQSSSFVRALPQQAQGYLILDQTPSVDYWEIGIVRRSFVDDTTYNETILQRHQLWDKHYLRIDKAFWNVNSPGMVNAVIVQGFDKDHNLIVEEDLGLDDPWGEIGIPTYFQGCYWDCNGPNYAYRIQQFRRMANPDMGHYSIMPAYAYYNEQIGLNISYFMYMIPEQFMQYTNDLTNWSSPGYYDENWIQNGLSDPWVPTVAPMLPAFHGMGVEWDIPGDLGDYESTGIFSFNQFLDDLSTGGYTSPDGVGISTPWVYGMQKYKGWWRDENFRLPGTTQTYLNVLGDCSEPLSWMIDRMNSSFSNLAFHQSYNSYNNDPDNQYADFHPNYLPDFKCDGAWGPGVDVDTELHFDCFYSEWYLDWVIDQIENGDDYLFWAEILGISLDCFGYADDGDDHGGTMGGDESMDDVLTVLEYVSMTRYTPTHVEEIFTFIPQVDLFDSTGAYTPQGSQSIDPGLYNLSFKYPNHPPTSIIFENKTRLLSDLPLSSFVDATVYPVPIVDDYSFHVHLQSTARSSFRYELYDFQGNLLHFQNVHIPKDHDKHHLVNLSYPLPDGILLHKFLFNDGSHFTVNTIK
jgi:hypothetical protein